MGRRRKPTDSIVSPEILEMIQGLVNALTLRDDLPLDVLEILVVIDMLLAHEDGDPPFDETWELAKKLIADAYEPLEQACIEIEEERNPPKAPINLDDYRN